MLLKRWNWLGASFFCPHTYFTRLNNIYCVATKNKINRRKRVALFFFICSTLYGLSIKVLFKWFIRTHSTHISLYLSIYINCITHCTSLVACSNWRSKKRIIWNNILILLFIGWLNNFFSSKIFLFNRWTSFVCFIWLAPFFFVLFIYIWIDTYYIKICLLFTQFYFT